jgi:hypothetical protein
VTRARAEDYRRRAQECLDLARAISLERERAVLIDMAQNWLRLAKDQDAQEEISQPPDRAASAAADSAQGRRQEGIGLDLANPA